MTDDVERVPDDETDAAEAWQRLTDDPEILGIEVSRHPDPEGWQVYVWVAEFLREDPLEAEFRQRMNAALVSVEGVASVAEEDREVWFVTGTASGLALTSAAAQVVDELADRTRTHVDGL